jgi:drug/metabolite transporter (DMT)-like permease
MQWFHRLPNNLKGALFLMQASILFSVMVLIIKLLGQHLHITQILFIRQLGMIVMVMPAIVGHFPGSLKSNSPGLQLSRIGLAVISMLFSFSAVIHLPLADATAISFAKSFFITIFAVLFLKEVVGVYRWSAVAIGFVGVMIMLQPGTAEFSIYSISALVGVTNRQCRHHHDLVRTWRRAGHGDTWHLLLATTSHVRVGITRNTGSRNLFWAAL